MHHGLKTLLVAVACLTPVAQAATVASASSPDGKLKVELDLNGGGRLAYRIARNGQSLVEAREVTRSDVMALWLAGGGGAAVRFVPLEH